MKTNVQKRVIQSFDDNFLHVICKHLLLNVVQLIFPNSLCHVLQKYSVLYERARIMEPNKPLF